MVIPPPVAVTVRVDTTGAAAEDADNVNLLLPLPGAAMLDGAKVAVAPLGRPLTDNVMAELKPLAPVVVKVMGNDPPGARLTPVAPTASAKLGI